MVEPLNGPIIITVTQFLLHKSNVIENVICH